MSFFQTRVTYSSNSCDVVEVCDAHDARLGTLTLNAGEGRRFIDALRCREKNTDEENCTRRCMHSAGHGLHHQAHDGANGLHNWWTKEEV